jgi:hypothetical protein
MENVMAYNPGTNRFNPLLIGAIAVILALAAFLVFRDGTQTSEQARVETQPPTATTPAPNPASPQRAPATPPSRETGSQ